jgi:endogenous inhibitor of DNA gyrase (YacG/DUF329 family)
MPQQPVRKVPCPRCGTPCDFRPSNPWRPFCSERCKMIDLGKWAADEYCVPAAPGESGEAPPQDEDG